MPINRTPIVENPRERDEKSTIGAKNEEKVNFCISEPKYNLDDVILSETVELYHILNIVIRFLRTGIYSQ